MDNEAQNQTTSYPELLRGVFTTSYNNSVTLVRAGIEEVGKALLTSHPGAELFPNVVGEKLNLGTGGVFLLRLEHQMWTQVLFSFHLLYYYDFAFLNDDWMIDLSSRLSTRVLDYSVSDTAGVFCHSIYDEGVLVEAFEMSRVIEPEEEDGEIEYDETPRFFSSINSYTLDDIIEIDWEFPDRLFREQDAFEPGLTFESFLEHQNICRAQP